MSTLLCGWGQLYNGNINKTIWLILMAWALIIPIPSLIAWYAPPPLTLELFGACFIALIGCWTYGMYDAYHQAKHHSTPPQHWQNSGVYILTFLLTGAVLFPVTLNYARTHFVESFLVPSGSMEPTILTNEMFFADKRYNCIGCKPAIERGDIAVFIYPNDRTQYFIKRIIGLGGDKIRIKDNDIYINDKPITLLKTTDANGITVTETNGKKTWTVYWKNTQHPLPQTEITLPNGYMFALGDNRAASHDSRFFGIVPLQNVVGKARFVWLSVKGNTIRWDRMGKQLP